MFGYIAAALAAGLGWALYDQNKKPSGTPLQNAGAMIFKPGQKIRFPLNQLPPNVVPPQMLATFNQVSASSLIVQVNGQQQPGMVSGNLIATDGPGGQIMMPTPLPVTLPAAGATAL